MLASENLYFLGFYCDFRKSRASLPLAVVF